MSENKYYQDDHVTNTTKQKQKRAHNLRSSKATLHNMGK